jgi:hypothetical protein
MGLLTAKGVTDTSDDGTIIAKVEYDSRNNPVELYTLYEDWYFDEVFDPWTNIDDPKQLVLREVSELRLVAKIEYYDYKNPLGNTVGAIWPQLRDFKINNAIKRITTVEMMATGSIAYKDYNEYGYPQNISGSALLYGQGLFVELMLDYVVKK